MGNEVHLNGDNKTANRGVFHFIISNDILYRFPYSILELE